MQKLFFKTFRARNNTLALGGITLESVFADGLYLAKDEYSKTLCPALGDVAGIMSSKTINQPSDTAVLKELIILDFAELMWKVALT